MSTDAKLPFNGTCTKIVIGIDSTTRDFFNRSISNKEYTRFGNKEICFPEENDRLEYRINRAGLSGLFVKFLDKLNGKYFKSDYSYVIRNSGSSGHYTVREIIEKIHDSSWEDYYEFYSVTYHYHAGNDTDGQNVWKTYTEYFDVKLTKNIFKSKRNNGKSETQVLFDNIKLLLGKTNCLVLQDYQETDGYGSYMTIDANNDVQSAYNVLSEYCSKKKF